jgi:hypothetical protein
MEQLPSWQTAMEECRVIREQTARGWIYTTRLHVSLAQRWRDRGIRTGSWSTDMMCRLTMAELIYFPPTSLDGYIADETGNPVQLLR